MKFSITAIAVAICCSTVLYADPENPYEDVDKEIRLAAIRHAQVWTPVDIASKNLRRGPQEPSGFLPGAVVECTYIEEEQRGTPKFDCTIPPDDDIRVKYGLRNGEIYAEVAASRLLWALGFGADRMYPVTVVCNGCPVDPIEDEDRAEGTRTFTAAVVERKFPGDEIESDGDEGWHWRELSVVDQTRGGAPLAHRDALKLLAAMIQHTDTKPEQQRLVCLDRVRGLKPLEDGRCAHPFMTINDLGKTFGKASFTNADDKSAVNFQAWSSVPVWKDEQACVAQLSKSFTGSLEHPKISEEGRQFLADLLSQLSDEQLRDLFDAARFTMREPEVPVDEWVRVFKAKRDEIARARCAR